MEKGTISRIACLKIPKIWIETCVLSVPAWDLLKGGLGLCRDTIRKGAPPADELPKRCYNPWYSTPYDQHLRLLTLSPADKYVLTGARSLGNNLGTIGWDREKGLLELQGENATRNNREYTCLCKTATGELIIDRLSFLTGKPNRNDLLWAVSGPELVWDGSPSPLWRVMAYDYDQRHLWKTAFTMDKGLGKVGRVPTGNEAQLLSNKFVETMNLPPQKASQEITALAENLGLKREKNYLHSAIGITPQGDILIVQVSGSFEQVSAALVLFGAEKGIEMDQGGSCCVKIGGDKELATESGITLFGSSHFRKYGLGLLIFKLNEIDFLDVGDFIS